MKQFFTVFRFELDNYLKNKAYIILTVSIVLICGIVMTIPTIIKNTEESIPASSETLPGEDFSSDSYGKLLVLDSINGGYTAYLASSMPACEVEETTLSPDEAIQCVTDGECEALVHIEAPLKYTYYVQSLGLYDYMRDTVDSLILMKYKQETAAQLGLTEADTAKLLYSVTEGGVVETGKSFINNFFYTYILIFMLYMAVLLYGQFVANSVATEKSSRAMELLITSAKSNSLMFGKVFGSGIAGLIQMSVILLAAVGFYHINSNALSENEILGGIFNMPIDAMLYTVLFFVLGFFIYAFMYAALASLASKMEDVQTLIMPVMFMFIAAFIIAFSGMMGDVDSVFVKVFSFIPFTSPMVMFIRICLSTPAWWEITLSVAILIGSTVFIGVTAAKIYRIGVLLYGKPPKIGAIIKALKYN